MKSSTITDVKNRIDQIDNKLVEMIAQRGKCVKTAAAFKTVHAAVCTPDRVQ